MKKHFLLALLTLLPLVGWAANYEVTALYGGQNYAIYSGSVISPEIKVNGEAINENYFIQWTGQQLDDETTSIPVTGNNLKWAGTYTLTVYNQDPSNTENLVEYGSAIFIIEKAVLQVQAMQMQYVYGELSQNPEPKVSVSGWKGTDRLYCKVTGVKMVRTSTSFNASEDGYSFSIDATKAKVIKDEESTYQNDYQGDNYIIETIGQGSELFISKKPVTLTVADYTKTYGDVTDVTQFTATVATMVGNEKLAYTIARKSDNENAGVYENELEATVTEDAVSANYDVTVVAGKFTINQKTVDWSKFTVTGVEESYTYTGKGITPLPTITDPDLNKVLVKDQDYTLNYYNYIEANDNTGASDTRTRLKIKLAENGNYTGAQNSIYYKIDKAPLTISTENAEKEYGEDDPDFKATYTGFVNGETAAALKEAEKFTLPTLSREEGNNVGYYTISATGAKANNYEITYATTENLGKLTITKATLTVTPTTGQCKEYGAADPEAYTFALSGFKYQDKAETLAAEQGYVAPILSRAIGENVGKYLYEIGNEPVATNYLFELSADARETMSGEIEVAATNVFEIKGATLTVTASAEDVNYGGGLPQCSWTATGFKGTEDASVITGTATYQYKVNGVWTDITTNTVFNAGTYALRVKEGTLTATNYTIVCSEEGTLTVNAATLNISIAHANILYGEELPALSTYTMTATGLQPGDELATLLNTENAVLSYTDSEDNVVTPKNKGTYNVTVTGLHANSYNIGTVTGTLTIDPLPFNITVKDQTHNYGVGLTQGSTSDIWTSATTRPYQESKADVKVVLYTDDPNTTDEVDPITNFEPSADPYVGVIKARIDNPNYTLAAAYKWGNLTVTNNLEELVLGRTDAKCGLLIKAYDQKEGMTVKFESRDLKGETWQAMAFPFEITVAEFNNVIYEASRPSEEKPGVAYAVVNILNPEATASGNPQFKLWMREIPANTPFLFKIYNGVSDTEELGTFNMKDLVFTGKTIKWAEEAVAEDSNDNHFFGIYYDTEVTADGYTWLFNHNKGQFSKYTGTSRTINPLTGYLTTKSEIDAFARITVEEIDGTQTSINSINNDVETRSAEGWFMLNGMKLQGVPTEKGIYIHNGKKVVVK